MGSRLAPNPIPQKLKKPLLLGPSGCSGRAPKGGEDPENRNEQILLKSAFAPMPRYRIKQQIEITKQINYLKKTEYTPEVYSPVHPRSVLCLTHCSFLKY